ncbi:glutamyl-tRNA reductase [Arthrobacter sp. H41]|uniref:glutamyl-tRNA reductase n=1 Tax=Arthrobacter sp. H41 TaxID=1312978 RepID=UPI0004AF6C51|nr:glutamyl-tRNA reductase [Arthrobacter sp. H41]
MSETSRSADPEVHPAQDGSIFLAQVRPFRGTDAEVAALLQAVSTQITKDLLTTSSAVIGAIILATCNRFEIYCETSPTSTARTACSDTLESVSHCTGLALFPLSSLFAYSFGLSVTQHLFTVGADLDSAGGGEREMSTEIRSALAMAQAAGTASARLVRLFQAASRTADEVEAWVDRCSTGTSIATVALDIATGFPRPALSEVSVVLLGTGNLAGCVVELLKSRDCSAVCVFSWSGRAEAFTAQRGGTALTLLELPTAMARADMLIGCSGAGARITEPILALTRRRAGKPLTVLDLALSRDFDPQVAGIPGVELITLEAVQLAAPATDLEVLRHAYALVQQAAHQLEKQAGSD